MTAKSQEHLKNFKNLLEKGASVMAIPYDPVVPPKKSERSTPEQVKLRVLVNQGLNEYINETTNSKDEKEQKILLALQLLNEIRFERNVLVMRSSASIAGILMSKLLTEVLINETSIDNLKESLDHQHVIYLPSHRSYADFVLVSYAFMHYNLDVPAAATGINLSEMIGIGEIFRRTGSFFIRRTFGEDEFYWRVFKAYMHEIVTYHDRGLEFYIEGTRSRSHKALKPKIGLLSMALEPFFKGEIPDLKIVPISISYEKLIEQDTLVYELLGMPKPKETTMNFLKAVTNLKNQNFGKVYFDICAPMSLKEYFRDKIKKTAELEMVKNLADEVVRRQQENMIITTSSLVALVYNEAVFMKTVKDLSMFRMKEKIKQLAMLLEKLGAFIGADTGNLQNEISNTLIIHRDLLKASGSYNHIQLVKSNQLFSSIKSSELKGVQLNTETMNIAVPVFKLQFYCNPSLFWLAQPAFIVLSLVDSVATDVSKVKMDFEVLRGFFLYEFAFSRESADSDFEEAIEKLLSIGVIEQDSVHLRLQKSEFTNFLLSAIAPFVNSFSNTSSVVMKNFLGKNFTQKEIFTSVQTQMENEILEKNSTIHPYSLCLESIDMVLLSLCDSKCLVKQEQLSLCVV